MTCQTPHTYNTLPVLFSNFLPSTRVVAQISSPLATLLYENQQYQGYHIIVFLSKKSLRLTFEYSWGGGVKSMFLPFGISFCRPCLSLLSVRLVQL